ncbi:carbamoyltransferase N-terminal domain-containing protein [Lentzea rhizosphaerae]|uniref:Carbamoyltransferase N-terminal domain-containing protein n=1 Tax=Lentzea rhizosphaerae TaxID=2041025 RepID=A0ABV8BP48_9PSEU
MLICGVKATHDGGVALIADGRLEFSIELEKLGNGPRYSALRDLRQVADLLAAEGVDVADVDRFVVDGWWTQRADGQHVIDTLDDGKPVELPVASYLDGPGAAGPLRRFSFQNHDFSRKAPGYSSYHHAANHLMGAYCTSPFARRGEDALVLVWDGGMTPRLYEVSAATRTVKAVSVVLPIVGNSFSDFCGEFDPFYRDTSGLSSEETVRYRLSIAGKAMAYAALGEVVESSYQAFDDLFSSLPGVSSDNGRALGEKASANRAQLFPGMSEADLIATFQAYLGDRLLRGISAVLHRRFPGRTPNLVLSGGCALNIKWNNRLRSSGLFADVWVPPFPNDAGAAIGTASCEMFQQDGRLHLDWNVYSGPGLVASPTPPGWEKRSCDERELAELLHTTGEPVVVLSGRAEIGPRALGNRSILATATSPEMKDRLNTIKNRASYRPVAPICTTARAPEIFAPGSSDRYMLFEHHVRPEWVDRIPAVIHLDGTARLQTIDPEDGSVTGRVLAEYERISGIPVLCNTSANHEGRGFFPDVTSAAAWGGTRYIWSEGDLYVNRNEPTSRSA